MRANAKADVKPQINNLIELYQTRKISNVTTEEKMILKLRTIEASTKNKTLKQYDKLVNKYENKEQLNVRMQRTKTINKEKKVVAKKKPQLTKYRSCSKSLLNQRR